MQDHFQVLDWDSRFFNIRIAQIRKNLFLEQNREVCFNNLVAANVGMAYYTCDLPLEEDSRDLYDFHLVDQKVSVRKELFSGFPLHEKIGFFDAPNPSQDLIDLAHRAGNFSRFSADPYISDEKVKELYEIWITKSVEKEMASEILVYREKGEIKGFITLKIDPPHGQTPLFAVSRNSEGKGVSFALMRAADSVLYERGCTYLTSATQAYNKAAVTVFKRHGGKIGSVEYVYHLWKK